MVRPQTPYESDGLDFARAVLPKLAGKQSTHSLKSQSHVDLHISTDIVEVPYPPGEAVNGRPRKLSVGQKSKVAPAMPPTWTEKAYLNPATRNTKSGYMPYPSRPRTSASDAQVSERKKEALRRSLSTIESVATTNTRTKTYRISAGFMLETDDLAQAIAAVSPILASPTMETEVGTGQHAEHASLDRPEEQSISTAPTSDLIARKLTVTSVKAKRVEVRGLSKALPLGQSPPRPRPSKQPFDWPRRIDSDYVDPAIEHSRRYRQKRKQTRTKSINQEQPSPSPVHQDKEAATALAMPVRKPTLIDLTPSRPGSAGLFSLLDLEPDTGRVAELQTEAGVDLLDSPIREDVRKSVLAPVHVTERVKMWEMMR
jgi:hypothetical protein